MITAFGNFCYTHRQGIFLVVASGVISGLYNKKSRDHSTLADLSLHGRLKDVNFKYWLGNIEGRETVENAQKNPRAFILNQLRSDLFVKAIIPTIYVVSNYLSPTNPSLIQALKTLLSNSEKASKVALPFLDKIALNSRLSPLFNMRVILFAPLVAKLVHMALLYQNPDAKSLVNKMASRLSQGLEIISNVSYSLHSLSTSTTLYRSIAKVAYFYGVKPLVKTVTKELFQLTPEAIKFQTSDLTEFLKSLSSFIPGVDFTATTKLSMGLEALQASLKASSEPYDGEKLFTLFNSIHKLSALDDDIETKVAALQSEIKSALASGAISKNHSKALHKLFYEKRAEKALQLELKEIPAQFKQIMDDLKKLSSEISLKQYLTLKTVVKERLKKYWQNISCKQAEPAALNIHETEHLNKLFGYEGIFHQLATDHDDYFISLEYHYHAFNHKLELYLKNPENESMLLALAKHAQINREFFSKTQAYLKTLPENEQQSGTVSEMSISSAILNAPELAYRKIAPPIPAEFKFESKELAEAIAKLRQEAGAPLVTIPNLGLYS